MLPERTSEFRLIESFRATARTTAGVLTGIGDDTAVVAASNGHVLLATDMLLEGVHFDLSTATPRQIGRKVLAVNLSDVAAMAGTPGYALVSFALPRRLPTEDSSRFASELFAGIQELAGQFDTAVVGGDTNSWEGPLVINVALTGEVPANGAVCRKGARPGDWIFVTGDLGGSISGHHLEFIPRVREAKILSETCQLRSMIDVSDGLVADLYHVLEESGVGAVLHEEAIPISQEAAEQQDGRSPLEHALGDGEDFELLFTVSPDDGRKLIASNPLSIRLSCIGEINAGASCQLRDGAGRTKELPRLGWSHGIGRS